MNGRATATLAVPPDIASGMSTLAVLYGVPAWGFVLLWGSLAASLTVRAIRAGLTFDLTWWSFTFPVGTMVTGTTALVVGYAGLLAAQLAVGIRTAHGSLRGNLLQHPRRRLRRCRARVTVAAPNPHAVQGSADAQLAGEVTTQPTPSPMLP